MKQNLTLFLLLFSLGLGAQTIFVKSNAAGLNNGTSWANAYTSLDQALLVATAGQSIWVSAGTYKPSNPAPNNSFYVTPGIELYGGFAGTETSLGQRNLAANTTTLSGDILGDDIAGNFTANKADNAQHVVVGFVITDNTGLVIDGFTIRGGQTLTGTANTDLTRRGGGMLLNAKATVRNCLFTDNFGESGAGLAALDALSDQILLDNCIFDANNATEDGVCFLRATPTGTIKNCIFRHNKTRRGALYPANSVNMNIQNCTFDGNTAKGTGTDKFYGAGMFTWQSTFNLDHCTFRKNVADDAAGIYVDGRDGGDLATITNCLFENDTVIDFGGAGVYSWQATMALKNTTFKNNYAPNAAGMYMDGREQDSNYSLDSCTFDGNIATSYGCSSIWNAQTTFLIKNSTFKNNVAPSSGAALYNSDLCSFQVLNCLFEANKGNYAAAIANYGDNCIGSFDDCTFHNNQATSGGGAVSNGFQANVSFNNCTFLANTAAFGGAIFTQNVGTQLHVNGCLFQENNTTGTAGCILVNDSIPTTISQSTFYQNIGGTGGAISANGGMPISIEKCSFFENIATTQGAALNFNHVDCSLVNCVFGKNIDTGTGAGGAISNNASDDEISAVKAVNCTFADNVAVIGAGIAQWESALGNSKLTLLNCLFQNPDGDNYGIEDGAPEVFSSNGNQSSDQTLELYLTESKDLHNTTNNFQNADGNDYAPTADSPAADGGVSAGAPVDDILGILRTGTPDVGYREVKVSGTNNLSLQLRPLQCAPNPASDLTVLSFKNDSNGPVQITVWNQLGQQVADFSAEKAANEFSFPLNVTTWTTGNYKVQVRLGAVAHVGAFAKF